MAYGRVNVGGGKNTKDATATAAQLLSGYSAYGFDGKFDGCMKDNGTYEFTVTPGTEEQEIIIPKGYHNGLGKLHIKPVRQVKKIRRKETAKLTQPRYWIAKAHVGKYILFAGGHGKDSTRYDTVDAYDKSLVRTEPDPLFEVSGDLAGASAGTYALFSGGGNGLKPTAKSTAYDSSLTRLSVESLSSSRFGLAGATIGNYAIFAGGCGDSIVNTVDAYNGELTRISPSALSSARKYLIGTEIGDYALFCGGEDSKVVDAYDKSLTRIVVSELSVPRSMAAYACAGNYLLIASQDLSEGEKITSIDGYDKNLTKVNVTSLRVFRSSLAGAELDGTALFAGGYDEANVNVVESFDSSLTSSVEESLSVARRYLTGGTIGNHVIFVGGYDQYGLSRETDAYYYETVVD